MGISSDLHLACYSANFGKQGSACKGPKCPDYYNCRHFRLEEPSPPVGFLPESGIHITTLELEIRENRAEKGLIGSY
jgi:hypothetical protein